MEQIQGPARRRTTVPDILLLQGAVLIFAGAMLMSKYASGYPLLSWGFVLLYGGSIFLLFVYAILWQQFLKIIPLSTAYANRAMAMLWSMVFGKLLFSETIKWNMVVGVAVIAAGIMLMVKADAE